MWEIYQILCYKRNGDNKMENPLCKEVKLKKQKNLYLVCYAVLLICSLEVIVLAGHSISQSAAPDGWPKRLDKRKLYSSKYGFVYAGRKSAAVEVNRLLKTIVKELDENSTEKTTTTKGLILVTDTKEKPLIDIQKIIEVVQEAAKQQGSEESKKALKSVIEAKEKIEEQGMDMLLSIVPMPIEPNMLPEIVNEFPKELGQQIDFCIVVPTGRSIKYGMKKIFAAAIKRKKIGLAGRLVLLPLMPFIEQKVVDGMKKGRQLVLYELFMDKQEDLTEKQKEDKIKAYKRKLGIDDDSGPNRDTENNGQTKEIFNTTQCWAWNFALV